MATMWIDTHCHLDAPEFDADRDAVVARARTALVHMLVLPAVEAARLRIADIEILRLHYARTIAHWRARFAGSRSAGD